MHISDQLNAFLRDMEFPATKDDLLREAGRDGVTPEDRGALAALPDESFTTRWQIKRLLARCADRPQSPALAA